MTKTTSQVKPKSNFTISYCIPSGNRASDLKQVMPTVIKSANNSPPVEIVVLDYNSTDDIDEYMESLKTITLAPGNAINYIKYNKGRYYHMAHARNLVSLVSKGEYIVTTAADIYLEEPFFRKIRQKIANSGCLWIAVDIRRLPGVLAIERKEFIAAGGYDERFELYGPEDQEFNDRLIRRGVEYATLDATYLSHYGTSEDIRLRNYRLKISKREMVSRMMEFYKENTDNNVLVANKDIEWGRP
jgi:GT2 family glycosyltransferase